MATNNLSSKLNGRIEASVKPKAINGPPRDDGSIVPNRLYTRKEAMHPMRLPVSRITLIRLEAKKVLIPIRLDPSPKSSVFYSGENLLQARQSSGKYEN